MDNGKRDFQRRVKRATDRVAAMPESQRVNIGCKYIPGTNDMPSVRCLCGHDYDFHAIRGDRPCAVLCVADCKKFTPETRITQADLDAAVAKAVEAERELIRREQEGHLFTMAQVDSAILAEREACANAVRESIGDDWPASRAIDAIRARSK